MGGSIAWSRAGFPGVAGECGERRKYRPGSTSSGLMRERGAPLENERRCKSNRPGGVGEGRSDLRALSAWSEGGLEIYVPG
jgi:hypothetical protein